jgi:hypothetical protein
LIGRHRKGLLFHAHLTIEGSVALTFFSVALGTSKGSFGTFGIHASRIECGACRRPFVCSLRAGLSAHLSRSVNEELIPG